VIKDQVMDELVEWAVSRGLVLELVDPVLGRGQHHRFYAVRPAHAARPWGRRRPELERIGSSTGGGTQCTDEWDELGVRPTRAVLARLDGWWRDHLGGACPPSFNG
jgi:hypothetical protein